MSASDDRLTMNEATLRLALTLLDGFRHTGEVRYLYDAQDILVETLRENKAPEATRPALLDTLGRVRRDLSVYTADLTILDQAIENAGAAVEEGGSDVDLFVYLNNLGQSLADRYEYTSDVADLDAAECAYRQALDAAAHVGDLHGGLGTVVLHRYHLTGDTAHLDEAVTLHRAAAALLSRAEPERRAVAVYQLSFILFTQFRATSNSSLLREAADLARESCAPNVLRAEHRIRHLANLGAILGELGKITRDPSLVDEGVHAFEEALGLATGGHALRPMVLHGLSNIRYDQYQATGDPARLDQAVALLSDVFDSAPEAGIDYAGYVTGLANALMARFHSTEAPALLSSAIALLGKAVDAIPSTDSFRPMVQSTLGGALLDQADHLAAPNLAAKTRSEALVHLRSAATDLADDNVQSAVTANNLAVGLERLYMATRDPAALEEAERICQDQLALVEPNSVAFGLLVNTMTTLAFHRVELDGSLAALDDPERLLRRLLSAGNRHHAGRAVFAGNLALVLEHRLKAATASDHVRAEMTRLRREVVGMPVASPAARIRAAVSLAGHAADSDDWPQATADYSTALSLMSSLSPRTWRRADRESGLRRFFALASDAAACALNAGDPRRAVELLEQGRGVVLDHPHLERTGLEQLRMTTPELADAYEAIVAEVDQLGAGEVTTADWTDGEARQMLHRRQTEVLTAIRALGGGFTHFLSAPPYEELAGTLGGRTVVVLNVSEIRCDALILDRAAPRVVPLPLLTANTLRRLAARFLFALQTKSGEKRDDAAQLAQSVLTWLWHSTVTPVLSALGMTSANADDLDSRRIWWCPTGLLNFLPMHAAGRYLGTTAAESTLDFVVSSYTPTIRALADCLAKPEIRAAELSGVVAVGLAKTPGAPSLRYATDEATAVHREVGAGVLILDEDATGTRILTELGRYAWFHFAGHGAQNPAQPEEAVLCPHDRELNGDLAASRIAELRLDSAELAFLSACYTAIGRLDLADEPAHLAGAIQQAGYRHVIAARWEVNDRISARLVESFYRELAREPHAAATALHRAIRSERDRSRHHNLGLFAWAPYIHIGP